MDKPKTVEEAVNMCLSEGIKALARGDKETAAKLLVQPMNAFPNYSKLDPKKLVVVEPLDLIDAGDKEILDKLQEVNKDNPVKDPFFIFTKQGDDLVKPDSTVIEFINKKRKDNV